MFLFTCFGKHTLFAIWKGLQKDLNTLILRMVDILGQWSVTLKIRRRPKKAEKTQSEMPGCVCQGFENR